MKLNKTIEIYLALCDLGYAPLLGKFDRADSISIEMEWCEVFFFIDRDILQQIYIKRNNGERIWAARYFSWVWMSHNEAGVAPRSADNPSGQVTLSEEEKLANEIIERFK